MRAMCGLAGVVLLGAACSQSAPPSSSVTPPPVGEAHAHAAPHGGTLVELGEEFAHLELLLDPATGTLTAYALDGEAERPVRLPQASIEVSFVTPGGTRTAATLLGVSNALTGETESDTSQFHAVVPALMRVNAFEGSIKVVVVRGQRFEDVEFRYPSVEHE